MGQAKLRGTFEQRREQAIARNAAAQDRERAEISRQHRELMERQLAARERQRQRELEKPVVVAGVGMSRLDLANALAVMSAHGAPIILVDDLRARAGKIKP